MSNKARARKLIVAGALTVLSLLLPACATDGNLNVLGYTSKPNYNTEIKTVYVPIFKNRTFYRGLEFDLTKQIVRTIEAQTPYKVVSDCENADTELIGEIVNARKLLLLRNQQNTVREAQTYLMVQVAWRDRRTGEILSSPRKGPGAPAINQQLNAPQILEPMPLPGTTPGPTPPVLPSNVPTVDPSAPLPMVGIQTTGTFIPELGESITTSFQENVKKMAVQITSMMEEGW